MKIKIFTKELHPLSKDFNKNNFENEVSILEREINDWIMINSYKIQDIKTDYKTIYHHNNGGCDNMMAIITVLYDIK